jgi:hypothetical protein
MALVLLAREHLDAAIALMQGTPEPEPTPAATTGCPHPASKLRDATVMGGQPMVLCLMCGDEFPGTLETP